MKVKKIISFILTAIMLATICAAASAAGNPVELMYARGDVYGGGAFQSYASIYGYVAVDNIAYSKNVTIHYSFDKTNWKDVSASYHSSTQGNKEAWYFQIQDLDWADECTFAIKYEAAGKTYWDNNNGQNYKIKIWQWSLGENYAIGNAGIKVPYGSNDQPYVSSEGIFTGSVVVKNIAYQKVVTVRCTTDNWLTFTEVPATYESSLSNGLEIWTFSTQLPAGWSTLEYAVKYDVDGLTYWDNNFGSNYTIVNY